MVMAVERPNWEGRPLRDCGEHRTVGPHRAWCHDCAMWCAPRYLCDRCETARLRVSELTGPWRQEATRYAEARVLREVADQLDSTSSAAVDAVCRMLRARADHLFAGTTETRPCRHARAEEVPFGGDGPLVSVCSDCEEVLDR